MTQTATDATARTSTSPPTMARFHRKVAEGEGSQSHPAPNGIIAAAHVKIKISKQLPRSSAMLGRSLWMTSTSPSSRSSLSGSNHRIGKCPFDVPTVLDRMGREVQAIMDHRRRAELRFSVIWRRSDRRLAEQSLRIFSAPAMIVTGRHDASI